MRRFPSSSLPFSQRGITAILAAVLLGTVTTFFALATDTGRLFFEKRSQQKNTDLAALESALLYCRDRGTDIQAAAENTLTRNNFPGIEDGTSTASASFLGEYTVKVVVNQTTAPSLFERLMKLNNENIVLTTTATAKACEPLVKLALGVESLADVNLLNNVLGDFLGTTLAITVAGRDSLLSTSINLLEFTEGLASLGVSVGEDGLLTGSAAISDILSVAVDVLNADGGDSSVTASILQTEIIDLIVEDTALELGELLKISSAHAEDALNVSLNVFDLVRTTIMLAGEENNLVAEVPANLLGLVDVLVRLQVSEPPQIAIGNPELAKDDPYGANEIYVRSAALKTYISLELPILGALDGLLNNALLSEIADTVNDLLSLDLIGVLSDILCLVACVQEEDMIDIDILDTPRIDIALFGAQGESRVIDYDCTDEATKSVTVEDKTSTLSLALGQFAENEENASAAVFSDDPLQVSPIPVLDIGSIHVRKTCFLSVLIPCDYEYQQGAAWTTDKSLADRDAFAGGGIGLMLDSDILGDGPNEQELLDPASETGACPDLVENYDLAFCEAFNATDPIGSLTSTLSGVDIEFYNPSNGSLLGVVTTLIAGTADTLISTLQGLLDAVLATALDPIINQLLETLGVSLSNGSVGAELICENGTARLIQ